MCLCLLILVYPLGGDDRLDPPRRELYSVQKLSAGQYLRHAFLSRTALPTQNTKAS